MKRPLLVAVASVTAGSIAALWAGGELFSAALRADQLGTPGRLDPIGIAIFGAGLLAASGGVVAAIYTSARWFRSRHAGPGAPDPR